MNPFMAAYVIRMLFVVAMICLLALVGALRAHRERRPTSQPDGDARTSPIQRPAFLQGRCSEARSLRRPAPRGT